MPRHQAPKKDVASCEKLRGAASRQRTVGIRMGKPGGGNAPSRWDEHIVPREGTRGTETSKYPEEKKERSISQVAASERERAQTERHAFRGCGPAQRTEEGRGRELESSARGGKSPVLETGSSRAETQSTAGHEKSGGKQGGPPPKAKYDLVTDSA